MASERHGHSHSREFLIIVLGTSIRLDIPTTIA